MRANTHCHLVDLTVLQTSVSLTLGYLQVFAEEDARIKGQCNFTKLCRPLEKGADPVWNEIQLSLKETLAERHTFAFTNFFWNRKANIALARRIKAVMPSALIVFGGNDVTNQAETLLSGNSPVDIVVNGEGEVVFANLLATFLDGPDFHSVNGVSFRNESGAIITTPDQPRIDDLNFIPSPFLSNAFSARDLSTSIDITYEFSRGCPFKCAFCFWGAAIGAKTRRFSTARVRQDLDHIISHAGPVSRIWMADANFGMVDADVEIAYTLAELVQKHRKQVFLVTNWAKNTTSRVLEAATVLYRHGIITGVTLSAQSLNDDVLKIADRKNIPFGYYRQLQNTFRELGIPTYTELIFGMPGESYSSFLDGVAKVIEAGGSPIIHPLLLLNNTEYNNPHFRRLHEIESRFMSFMGHGVSEAEILISHRQLPYADWLKGMVLRLVVPLLYCGLMKFVITRLHTKSGVPYTDMLDALVDCCLNGHIESHSLFRSILLNYVDAWHSPSTVTALPPESGVLITETQFGDAHYRALLKIVLKNTEAASALITELAEFIRARLKLDAGLDFQDCVAYQKLLIEAMSQTAHRSVSDLRTNLSAALLSEYAGYDIARESAGQQWVRPRNDHKVFSPDEFAFRILYGSIDTLKMFARREPASIDGL